MNEQFLKDLELIKWNVEHREKEAVLQVIGIVAKRYGGQRLPDIVDPGQENLCDSCQ